jgi:NADH-ubiquinone oxidoreductase chain 4L
MWSIINETFYRVPICLLLFIFLILIVKCRILIVLMHLTNIFLLSYTICFLGLVLLSHQKTRLIGALISLEITIFGVLIAVYTYGLTEIFETVFCLVFLSFIVCESALGLGLLVLIVRSHGNDYLSNFNANF